MSFNLKESFGRIISGVKNPSIFDNVRFEDETLKTGIVQYFYELTHFSNISINSFADLFSKYQGIVFPICIYSGKPYHWFIRDNMGTHYCLSFDKSTFKPYTKYSIKTENNKFVTKSVYELKSDGIRLKQWDITNLPLERLVSFHYNSYSTTLFLGNFYCDLEMTYPSTTCDDYKIATFLLDFCQQNSFFDDIWYVLIYMKNFLKQNANISITSYERHFHEVERILLSSVSLYGSVVKNYFYTVRKNQDYRILYQEFPLESLETFALKHNKSLKSPL